MADTLLFMFSAIAWMTAAILFLVLLFCLGSILIGGVILVLTFIFDPLSTPNQPAKTKEPSGKRTVHVHHYYDNNGNEITSSEAPPAGPSAEGWKKLYKEAAAKDKMVEIPQPVTLKNEWVDVLEEDCYR